MSRIDSEPEMAIVIFRTCLEDILKILYPKEYQEKEENCKTLGPLIVNLFEANILFTKEKSNRDGKKEVMMPLMETKLIILNLIDQKQLYCLCK